MLTSVFQKIGTLMFKVHKRPDKHFEVNTPYLVAVVKGTTFTVSVDGNGSAVHVTEGLVEVGAFSGPEKLMLHPGQTGSISSKPGSKLQSGTVTPEKSGTPAKGKEKQTRGPGINQTIESASIDIEKASNGLFKNDRSRVRTQVASTGEGARSAVEGVAGTVGTIGSSVTGNVGSAIGGVTDGLGGAVGSVGGAVGGAVGAVGGLTDGLGGAIGGAVGSVGGTVSGVGGAVGGLTSGVGGAVSGITGGVGGAVSGLGGSVGGTVGGVVGSVGGTVSGVGGTVGGVVGGVGGTVGGVLGGLGGLLGGKKS
ncbi:MAG: hypothetical protein GEU87_10465 [Alphaproteobacteria bacterium]|nr:hypothetical protein [Alphaproteobacteria bacterium]